MVIFSITFFSGMISIFIILLLLMGALLLAGKNPFASFSLAAFVSEKQPKAQLAPYGKSTGFDFTKRGSKLLASKTKPIVEVKEKEKKSISRPKLSEKLAEKSRSVLSHVYVSDLRALGRDLSTAGRATLHALLHPGETAKKARGYIIGESKRSWAKRLVKFYYADRMKALSQAPPPGKVNIKEVLSKHQVTNKDDLILKLSLATALEMSKEGRDPKREFAYSLSAFPHLYKVVTNGRLPSDKDFNDFINSTLNVAQACGLSREESINIANTVIKNYNNRKNELQAIDTKASEDFRNSTGKKLEVDINKIPSLKPTSIDTTPLLFYLQDPSLPPGQRQQQLIDFRNEILQVAQKDALSKIQTEPKINASWLLTANPEMILNLRRIRK